MITTFLKRLLRFVISRPVQKRLGYRGSAKLLIIHADDMGMSDSENAGSLEAMDKGVVNSGSVMIPCRKFQIIADWVKTHTEADIGIHLTITSEWSSYKWGPVLPVNEIPSIVDGDGYFPASKKYISEMAVAEEVEKEYRAQITLAADSGLKPTHIDSHMYSAFATDEIINKYISLGNEFKVPVLLTYDLPFRILKSKNAIFADHLYCAKSEDYADGLADYYRKVLRSIKPGLNCLLVHPAYNDKEMQDITLDRQEFGGAWRQIDLDFFTSEECRSLIKENNIQLITWREIRDKLVL